MECDELNLCRPLIPRGDFPTNSAAGSSGRCGRMAAAFIEDAKQAQQMPLNK